jgi:transcriptional regulator with XRE-family HTH domain
MSDTHNFSEKITNLRKQKKMKQKELASLLKISQSTLSDYENSRSLPSIKILMKMCDIFNVPIDYFYSSYLIKQNKLCINESENDIPNLPIVSFINNPDTDTKVACARSAPPTNDILRDFDKFFYFESDNRLLLFQFFSSADYLDTVLAFHESFNTPEIFKAVRIKEKICFERDNIIYEQDKLKIFGVLYIPIPYRKYIIA